MIANRMHPGIPRGSTRLLRALRRRCSSKAISFDVPYGGDVVDWAHAGHSADELRQVIENARLWTPSSEEDERQNAVVPKLRAGSTTPRSPA